MFYRITGAAFALFFFLFFLTTFASACNCRAGVVHRCAIASPAQPLLYFSFSFPNHICFCMQLPCRCSTSMCYRITGAAFSLFFSLFPNHICFCLQLPCRCSTSMFYRITNAAFFFPSLFPNHICFCMQLPCRCSTSMCYRITGAAFALFFFLFFLTTFASACNCRAGVAHRCAIASPTQPFFPFSFS